MTAPLLKVDGLSVHVGHRTLLQEVSFSLGEGQVLTLLGESGAGKSLLAQAVMGNLPPTLRAGGTVTLDGQTTRANDAKARRPRWGRSLALLPQEPAQALDPLMRIRQQVSVVHELVHGQDFDAARAQAMDALGQYGLASAQRLYPWQLSGGMAQRAATAVARAAGARVLMADEPTKGLDGHWRDQTVAMLQQVQRDGGCLVVVTHDLRVARALGGEVIVLRAGEVVERGATAQVLDRPRHAFTQALVQADPAHWAHRVAPARGTAIVSGRGLGKRYGDKVLFEDIDLTVHVGERLAVQGPSGTGKSTLGNVLLGVTSPDRGHVDRTAGLAPTALQKLYQDPVASFAPRVRLGHALRDVAERHRCDWSSVEQSLASLGVAPDLLSRRPAEVSGGELQRIAMVRALMVRPAMLFADEPTSRLDPVSQQQAMDVLLAQTSQTGTALLLVTHDEDIARAVTSRALKLGATEPSSAVS